MLPGPEHQTALKSDMTDRVPPSVVIGIPTFNRVGSLAKAIESALAQDYRSTEVIVCDNASSDGTQELCERYAAVDPRVTYFRHCTNVGATRNFVQVLKLAKSEFFMWLADDDWLDPTYVRLCAEALIHRLDVVLVGGTAKYYQQGMLKSIGKRTNCLADRPERRVFDYYRQVEENGIFYGVMRRDRAFQIEMVNCLGGDWLFLAAMAYQGKILTIETTSVHRELGGSSENLKKMAAVLAVPSWQARMPLTFSLALNAAKDVAGMNKVYAAASVGRRLVFSLLIYCWILLIKPAQELKRRIRAGAKPVA